MKPALLSVLFLLVALPAFADPPTGPLLPPDQQPLPTVKFAWDQPDPVTEPDWEEYGYRIHIGTESGVYTTIVDFGKGIPAGIDEEGKASIKHEDPVELPPGTYFAALTCYNTYGLESDYSNEITFTRAGPPGAPRLKVTIQVSSNLEDWEPIASHEVEMKGPQQFFRLAMQPLQ